MRIGVLGTGMVGRAISERLAGLGHEVRVGSRAAREDAVVFADAARFGEVLFNCTAGVASLDALTAAGAENLAGKLLIDVSNPLEHTDAGTRLTVCNTESLGERIQRAFPDARVVKALNTMNCRVMVDPAGVPGEHVVFVCGDDEAAKAEATGLLGEFGWAPERVLDLGDITAARGTEAYLLLWVRMMRPVGTWAFNIAVARAG
jgi:predicted dinucleotide-binding enzyme